MKDILHKILFWTKWTRKLNKPLLTDADLDGLEKDIEEELHLIKKPDKVYKYKNNKYGH